MPDFKFELLPLHSPLLRQSLLVSFPPLIDMLKFSGYPRLIRGQTFEIKWNDRLLNKCTIKKNLQSRKNLLRLKPIGIANALQKSPFVKKRQASKTKLELDVCNDARTGVPSGLPEGAICVQRFDDSLNSAIHITYRISLRSSSMPEPRDPLLKVLTFIIIYHSDNNTCYIKSL